MTVTLAEIRIRARQRSDMVNSEFISDSEVNSYINNSIAELHDILSNAYGSEYFVVSTADLPIIAAQSTYALPADFYELKGLDIQAQDQVWTNVEHLNFNERNKYANANGWDLSTLYNVRYRIVGSNIIFSPTPDSNTFYRVWYTPLPAILVNDSDELEDFNAYSEYVIVDVAIKMLQKEESDVTVLFAQKKALIERIEDKAQNRDAANADTITDVYSTDSNYPFRRGV